MGRFALLISAAPLALISTNVHAQNTTDISAQHLDAEGDQPSVTESGSGQSAVDPRDIVVTGYRASLSTAQAIKRDSDATLDSIVAQDIGKLPDNTAAESLARITGVQVTRFGDEVNGVLVRGLGDIVTTFNGREIFTAELRTVRLQDFPSGSLSGLEVYKSGTAELIEPGLAGLINVRSRRAFDFKDGVTVAGGIRGTYNDQSEKYDPQGNLMVSWRKDTGIGEIGILVNGSYTQSQYRNAVRFGSSTITTLGTTQVVNPGSVGRDFRYPDRIGVFSNSGKRWRPSANASLQWKPAPNFEVYADFLYQGFRQNAANDLFEASLRAMSPTLNDVVMVDGKPDQVQSFTKVGGERSQMYRSTADSYTNTFQYAGGFKWDVGRARITSDLAFTKSEFGRDEWSFDTANTSAPTINVEFFNDGGVAFDLPGFDANDPANYKWRGFFELTNRVKGEGWQWRTDVDLETDVSFLPKIQVGLRWSDRNASLQQGSRYAGTERLNLALDSLPIGELNLIPDAFRTNVQGFRQWLMPSRAGIVGGAPELRELALQSLQQLAVRFPTEAGLRDAIRLFSTPEVQLDPYTGFAAKEATYTAYGQAKYELPIGSWEIDGLVGLRVVNTVGEYSGISSVTFDGVRQPEPRVTNANYVDLLPNFSMRIRPTNRLQLRFAYTKTRTRPEFGRLNPAITITQNNAAPTPDAPPDPRFPADLQGRPDAFGSGGNPNLRPLTSTNYDATAEYYFSRTASITAGFFYRDLDGFINTYARRVRDPLYGLLEITIPENAGKGRIKGFELGGQTFLDFLPGLLSGFGVQANVTYLDGKNRYPAAFLNSAVQDPPFVKIPFLSKWTYNAALFYEKGKISTRLSYNHRSPHLISNLFDANGVYNGEAVRSISRLDYSFNINPIPQVTLTFDATNLLAQPFQNYWQYGDDRRYPRDVRDEGRYFGLGARFRF